MKFCRDCEKVFCANRPLPASALMAGSGRRGLPPTVLSEAVRNATCEAQGGYKGLQLGLTERKCPLLPKNRT